jgi:hypothetical protein
MTDVTPLYMASSENTIEYDRSDQIDTEFWSRIQALLLAAQEQGVELWIRSGFRTYEEQASLWEQAVIKYGEADASTYVARPGSSNHNRGLAFDIAGDWSWLAQNAASFGLDIPMSWEPWHVEPLGLRDGSYGAEPWVDAYTINPDFPNPAQEGRGIAAQMRSVSTLLANHGKPINSVIPPPNLLETGAQIPQTVEEAQARRRLFHRNKPDEVLEGEDNG